MPVAQGVPVGGGGSGVDGEHVEPAALGLVDLDVVLAAEGVELGGGEPVDEVDLALAQCLHGGVGVAVEAELEFVDLGGSAPVVGVGFEADELLGAVLGDQEGAVAHDGHGVVAVAGDLVDLGPDVLGDDGHVQGEHRGLGFGGGDDQGGRVGCLDGLEGGDVAAVGGARVGVVHHEVEGERDVVGGHRFPVGPGDVVPDGVGPGEVVVGGVPGFGEGPGGGHVLGAGHGEGLVGQAHEFGRGRHDRLERVERVDALGDAEPQHGAVAGVVLRVGLGRAQGCDGRGGGHRQHSRRDPDSPLSHTHAVPSPIR